MAAILIQDMPPPTGYLLGADVYKVPPGNYRTLKELKDVLKDLISNPIITLTKYRGDSKKVLIKITKFWGVQFGSDIATFLGLPSTVAIGSLKGYSEIFNTQKVGSPILQYLVGLIVCTFTRIL